MADTPVPTVVTRKVSAPVRALAFLRAFGWAYRAAVAQPGPLQPRDGTGDPVSDDPVNAAERLIREGMPTEVARALAAFRVELAEHECIDSDEAAEYGSDFLGHLLAAWLPEGCGE